MSDAPESDIDRVELSSTSEARDHPEAPVSVVVFTYMEELNLDACLRSISGWAGEIYVVDSGSTDLTRDIALRYTPNVHIHEYVNHSQQIRYALSQLPLTFEWVLILDADHRLTDGLRREIAATLQGGTDDIGLFYCPQIYLYRGHRIRSLKKWVRLLRRGYVTVDASELVDFRYKVDGRISFLRGIAVEENLKENDLDFWIDKHQRFSSRAATEELLRRHGHLTWSAEPRLLGSPDERVVWLKTRWISMPLFVRPFLYFTYRFVWKLGFLGGRTEWFYDFMHAFWFRLIVDVKLWELERSLVRGELNLADLEVRIRGS